MTHNDHVVIEIKEKWADKRTTFYLDEIAKSAGNRVTQHYRDGSTETYVELPMAKAKKMLSYILTNGEPDQIIIADSFLNSDAHSNNRLKDAWNDAKRKYYNKS